MIRQYVLDTGPCDIALNLLLLKRVNIHFKGIRHSSTLPCVIWRMLLNICDPFTVISCINADKFEFIYTDVTVMTEFRISNKDFHESLPCHIRQFLAVTCAYKNNVSVGTYYSVCHNPQFRNEICIAITQETQIGIFLFLIFISILKA